MGPPKRKVLATAQETLIPPDELPDGHYMARVVRATGNNVYSVELPSKKSLLVELPSRFRSTFWLKRGSYVVVDTKALEERENKLGGEIVNIVRGEKAWRKAPFWPTEFVKQSLRLDDNDNADDDDEEEEEEDSKVGRMPPSDESDA